MRPTGFEAFDRLLGLAHPVRMSLAEALEGALEPRAAQLFTDAVLPHLELVEAGARASVPADALAVPHASPPDGSALEAAGQARIVLALVPTLPSELTSWPGPGSYSDLRPPSDGPELLARIEELSGVLWRAIEESRLPVTPPVRRTFAFFETASWLSVAGPRGFAGMGRH
jgi:hypothetical protein